MYAYKQQAQVRPLPVAPQKRVVTKPRVQKKAKKIKKQNPIIEFFRLLSTLAFLSAFIVFVHPTAYNSLIKQVFYPTKSMVKTEYNNSMNDKNIYNTDVNLYNLA